MGSDLGDTVFLEGLVYFVEVLDDKRVLVVLRLGEVVDLGAFGLNVLVLEGAIVGLHAALVNELLLGLLDVVEFADVAGVFVVPEGAAAEEEGVAVLSVGLRDDLVEVEAEEEKREGLEEHDNEAPEKLAVELAEFVVALLVGAAHHQQHKQTREREGGVQVQVGGHCQRRQVKLEHYHHRYRYYEQGRAIPESCCRCRAPEERRVAERHQHLDQPPQAQEYQQHEERGLFHEAELEHEPAEHVKHPLLPCSKGNSCRR